MNNKIQAFRANRGVTILELMVVLSCLAILGAVVAPNWIATAWPAYRLKSASRQIASDIRHARIRAVSTNRQYRLRIDPVSDSYVMERGDASSSSSIWIMEGSRKRFGRHKKSAFPGVGIGGGEEYRIVFQPTGGGTNKTVTLENSLGQTMKIVCSMAGRIRFVREG